MTPLRVLAQRACPKGPRKHSRCIWCRSIEGALLRRDAAWVTWLRRAGFGEAAKAAKETTR